MDGLAFWPLPSPGLALALCKIAQNVSEKKKVFLRLDLILTNREERGKNERVYRLGFAVSVEHDGA